VGLVRGKVQKENGRYQLRKVITGESANYLPRIQFACPIVWPRVGYERGEIMQPIITKFKVSGGSSMWQ